ncbi:MAG: hypothetical protein ACR2PR_06780 [Pseudohongiellaceae bacterium]
MKTFFKWLGIVLMIPVVGVLLIWIASRFSDGPLWAAVTGGPFRSGELVQAPDDWSFLRDYELIDFQTMEPARSRTVWLGVLDRRLFIVSGYMDTSEGALWKHWPYYLEADDNIILRVDGNLYEQRLERINGGPLVARLISEYNRKYNIPLVNDDSPVTSGSVWMYEVVDR